MRVLSATALDSIFSQETGEVWLYLLTIEHAEMSTVRLVNDNVDIVSNGDTFSASPFQLTLPPQNDGELPKVDLVIDNIGRDLMAPIRTLTGQPIVTLVVVMASAPDTIEVGPYVFSLKDVQYNPFVLRGQISYEPLLTEPFNFRKFTPIDWPGMFTVIK